MQTKEKYLNFYMPLHFLFFLLFNPKLVVHSLSGILFTHTRRDELRRFPLPLLRIPTLPYPTLHYSPSKEVDTIQESKSGTVRRTINICKARTYLPTYLGTYMYLFGLQRMLKVGRYRYLYTYGTLPGTYLRYLTYHKSITMIHVRRRWTVAARNMHHHHHHDHFQIERG